MSCPDCARYRRERDYENKMKLRYAHAGQQEIDHLRAKVTRLQRLIDAWADTRWWAKTLGADGPEGALLAAATPKERHDEEGNDNL